MDIFHRLSLSDLVNRISTWFLRWRLWIIGITAFLIVAAEIVEHFSSAAQFYPFHLGETVLYITFLVVITILMEALVRALESKTHANHILHVKHQLAQQLGAAESWQTLADQLHEFARTLAPNTAVDLLIPNQGSASWQVFSSGKNGAAFAGQVDLGALAGGCVSSCEQEANTIHALQSCDASRVSYFGEQAIRYCMPFDFGSSRISLHFYLHPATSLSSEQLDILNNISPEISLALKIVQQHIAMSESLVTNTAVTTRREISRDLHDTLGQNLSYLRLKLEQFTRYGARAEVAAIVPDLLQMEAAARESLQLLRLTLDRLQPESESHLAKFLQEHGKSVSERANFDFQFNTAGTSFPLTSSTLHQISCVYREALNNIERHAGAEQVTVHLNWGENELNILVEDDGDGFNPQQAQSEQHYGITNMQERMAALNGSIHFDTAEGAGMRLNIHLPLIA